ncbi:hypothetical protein [Paracoccus sp. SM22M-07]|uniref:hypothetical protein n=1 Tax=Paracoccus sp. SM22M-07 TaxID=1520813 RepID=UPI000930E9FD|nr:hypothetical protein [Paracoccus sp. SM22M-07]
MPFDRENPIAPQMLTTGQRDAQEGPGFGATIGAATRQSNMIGSILTSEAAWLRARGSYDEKQPDYNVFDDIKGYEDRIDSFIDVFNPVAAAAVKADIDREARDRKTLEASGWLGTAAEIGASIVDAPTLLPGGALIRAGGKVGYSVARSAGSVGAAAGAGAAIQEAGLQSSQELRSNAESAVAIGGSVVLGALLGGGVGAVMSRGEYRAATRSLQEATRPDFDVPTDALHAELAVIAKPESVGAAATPSSTLDDFSVEGRAASKVAKATSKLNPVLRTMHSPSKLVREIAGQMMENPVYLKRNMAGEGEAAAETAMKEWTRGALGETVEAMDAAYSAARKGGLKMNRTEFNQMVGMAMRRGDRSDVPEVAKAAAAIRSGVFDPLKDRAIAAGLLPEDVSVDTAETYFSRLWNHKAIEANEAEFKEILRRHFDGQITGMAQARAGEVEASTKALQEAREAIIRSADARRADAEALSGGVSRSVGDILTEDAAQAFRSGVDRLTGRVTGQLDEADAAKLGKIEADLAKLGQRGEFDFLSDADRMDYLESVVEDVYAMVTGRAHGGGIGGGVVPTKRGPLAERTFHIPDEVVEKFIESDADLVMRRYARIMSADIELQNRFGSVTMKPQIDQIQADYSQLKAELEARTDLTPKQKAKQLETLQAREKGDIADIEAVRDMLRGNFRPDIQHTNYARILAAAGTFNYVTALGGVVVSSLTDAVRPAMVHGLKAYMQDGIGPLLRNTEGLKLSKREAKQAGAIAEKVLNSRMATLAELTDPYSQGSPFERFLNNLGTGFTKMTGLLHWNDFQKTITATMSQNRILQNAETALEKGFDALPKSEQAYMGYLGVGRDSAPLLGRLFREHGQNLEGVRVANADAWPPEMEHMVRAWRSAVNKDVDSIIVTKGIGDVPVFANTPTGRALLQFRSFALASNQRVLLRGLQEDQTRMWGGVVGMAAIGSFVYWLKNMESGRKVSDNPGTWIAEGLDRSGIFSLAFEVNNALEKAGGFGIYRGAAAAFPGSSQKAPASRFATRNVVSGFMGPTFGRANDAVDLVGLGFRSAGAAVSGEAPDISAGDVSLIRRQIPGASLPYWRWLLDGQILAPLKEDLSGR